MKAPLRATGGFTLIEMLVATTVLALGLLGVIGMQLYAIGGDSSSWNMTLAQNIAQQKIEYLENESYNNCKATMFNTTVVYGSYANAVAAGVINASDEIPAGGDHSYNTPGGDACNQYIIDSEPYGGLMSSVGDQPYGGGAAIYKNFRRVTIQKVIDGYYNQNACVTSEGGAPTDCEVIIKVIVYWKDSGGHEHKVSMMGEKGFGT